MPSQAVLSLWGIPSLQKYMRHPRGLARRHGVFDIQFSEFRPQTRAVCGLMGDPEVPQIRNWSFGSRGNGRGLFQLLF
jgi:hypothetical protein